MPKQKSQTSPAKTIKSLFTKSTTLLGKLEAKLQIFKTQHDTWIKEIQALSTQVGLIEDNVKNSQIIFSADFRKNFAEIVKKFNKIKDGVDDEQSALNKIMEEYQESLIACIATAKKKAADIPLEEGLHKNIKMIETQKMMYQKLIQELLITIQPLTKRIAENEKSVNRLTIQPHLIELGKLLEKVCFGLELLCKETDSVALSSTPDEVSKVQVQFLQLFTLSKKIDPLLDQSRINLAKGKSDSKDANDKKENEQENMKSKPASAAVLG
jgi:hypothetical protein